jgi:hypothetical protein
MIVGLVIEGSNTNIPLFFFCRIILDTDANAIVGRVSKPRLDMVDIPFTEQTLSQAYQTARERLTSQLLR